jgi:hypothetical protein
MWRLVTVMFVQGPAGAAPAGEQSGRERLGAVAAVPGSLGHRAVAAVGQADTRLPSAPASPGPEPLRLPELALLAGKLISYVAAVSVPVTTGFWDRAGRHIGDQLRWALSRVHCWELPAPAGQLRKKPA